MRSLLALAVVVGSFATARAEHRTALVVAVDGYEDEAFSTPKVDVKPIVASLESRGFRCRVVTNPEGDEFRKTVEAFASSTPNHGTALVYFAGRTADGDYKGKKGLFLVGTDGKAGDTRKIGYAGVRVVSLLEDLAKRGGSSNNLVVIDGGADVPEIEDEIPEHTFLVAAKDANAVRTELRDGDLLDGLRGAGLWTVSTMPSDVVLEGNGTRAFAAPDEFAEGKKAGDEWVDARGTVFCWCPPGKVVVGSPESEPGRYPDETQREVVVEKGFWIAKYELTLRENTRNAPRNALGKQKDDPLSMMHLDDARAMFRQWTAAEREAGRIPDGWEYTIPSPDHWEYAARAGTTTAYSFGDDVRGLPDHGNFGDRSYYETGDPFANSAHRTLDDGTSRLARVGQYTPNPWGLHDLHGNVAEFCWGGAVRGGSWISPPAYCRSAHRDAFSGRATEPFLGFRVVVQPNRPEPKKK